MKNVANVTRLSPGYWSFIILLVGVGWIYLGAGIYLYLRDKNLTILLLAAAMALLLTLITLPMAYELVIKRIRWDDTGIWYRDRRGERFFAWQEITDYGLRYPARSKSSDHTMYLLVLSNGERIPFRSGWSNCDAFQDTVVGRATAAKTHTWEVIGTRRIDAPARTFRYPVKQTLFVGISLTLVSTICGVVLFFQFLPKIQEMFQLLGTGWGIACALTAASISLLLPLAIGWGAYHLGGEVLKNKHEAISVTENTITFSERGIAHTVPWSAVIDYYIDGADTRHYQRYVLLLAGDGNAAIRFHAGIQQAEILKTIVRQYAPKPEGEPWRYVGGDSAATKPNSIGSWWGSDSQVRTYTYHTAGTRFFLFFVTMTFGIMPVPMLLRGLILQEPIVLGPAQWIIFGVIGILLSYIWWRYLAARIVLDEESITQYTAFKVHRIRWQDVTNWHTDVPKGSMFTKMIVVHGADDQRIEANPLIKGFDDLKQEIERRTGMPPRGRDNE